jgi:hypothetical protein
MPAPRRNIAALVEEQDKERTLFSRKEKESTTNDSQVDFHFRISKGLRDELKAIFDAKGLTLNGGVRMELIEYAESAKKKSAF